MLRIEQENFFAEEQFPLDDIAILFLQVYLELTIVGDVRATTEWEEAQVEETANTGHLTWAWYVIVVSDLTSVTWQYRMADTGEFS